MPNNKKHKSASKDYFEKTLKILEKRERERESCHLKRLGKQ